MTSTYAAFIFLCIVFGTTFGAIKIEMADDWPPLLAAGLRFVIGGALVLFFAALRGELRPVGRDSVRPLLAVGLTVTAGTFGALYCAERILPSGLCALLSATSPLFAVALAIAAKQRRLDAYAVAGVVLGMLGVALIGGAGAISGSTALLAAAAIIVSELGFTWGLGSARAVSSRMPMLQFAGSQQFIGGCVLLVLSALVEHRGIGGISRTSVVSFVYLVLVGTATAHTVAIWLAARTNATFASSWSYISPFIALMFGALLLHEGFGATAWFGGICVAAGAAAINFVPSSRTIARIERQEAASR